MGRPTPAGVLATAALVVAVLGTSPVGNAAWNAVVPKGSVGTAQLKNDAVTSAKVRDGSLLKSDFKPGQLVPGATGPAGAAGPAGATGPAGPAAISGYEIVSKTSPTDSTSPRYVEVSCPAGKKAIGGGGTMNNSGNDIEMFYSYPSGSTGWYAGFKENTATANTWWAKAYVVCATVS